MEASELVYSYPQPEPDDWSAYWPFEDTQADSFWNLVWIIQLEANLPIDEAMRIASAEF